MLEIGKYNQLEIVKEVDFGLYLDGGPFGEILLPLRYVPATYEIGQELEIFLYNDSEDRLIATTERPKAIVGEFAFLEVKEVGEYGAFLDWGLLKDLFVPYREQGIKMKQGDSYLIHVYLDEATDRIAASSRWKRYVEDGSGDLEEGQAVKIFIAEPTDLGYKVIINQQYQGMLYANEVFQSVQVGDQLPAYIQQIREDQKVDVRLQKQGVEAMSDAAKELIQKLKDHQGFLPLTDKSAPELIYQEMQMSKKVFKKAVGILYKRRMIKIEKDGIHLLEQQ